MKLNLLFALVICFLGHFNLNAQENYKTLVYQGNQKFDSKNFEAASSKYLEAVQLNDKEFMAHYNLGNAFYKQKKFEEAKAEFHKAEQIATTLPDKSAALYNLGNAHMQLQDSKSAAQFYKQALKQDPYNENIRKNYEIAMLKEKEKEEQKNQKDNSGGGGEDNKEKNKGQEKGDQSDQQAGSGQKNKGTGEGADPNEKNKSNSNKMPKDLEDAILNRVGNKERETAKKILNKNSYSTPESNEKDW